MNLMPNYLLTSDPIRYQQQTVAGIGWDPRWDLGRADERREELRLKNLLGRRLAADGRWQRTYSVEKGNIFFSTCKRRLKQNLKDFEKQIS